MRYLYKEVPFDHAYLIPIGDIHVGDQAFGARGREKLAGYLAWVKARPNAFIFLMGDVFNCASRTSRTSPFESNSDEYTEAVTWFTPVKDRILGAIDGNHEARMLDQFGYSPTQTLCGALGIPYCQWSAVIQLAVGRLKNGSYRHHGQSRQPIHLFNDYYIYCHHTTGGGSTLGGALNRSVKLQDLIQGIDVYCGGHNHQLATGVRTVWMPLHNARRVIERKVTYVDCGSYLDWDGSYAEKSMLPVGKLGSPRLRFAGARRMGTQKKRHGREPAILQLWRSRDVHVSL